MLKMIAFDLDGTLGDTIPLCIEAFRRAVSPYSGRLLTDEEIIQTFGMNEVGMVKTVESAKWESALEDYYRFYQDMHAQCPAPFEGAHELLEFLKQRGIRLALITGKAKRSCDITLDRFGVRKYFEEVITGSENGPNKTEAMRELLHKNSLSPDEFNYVGDTVSDVRSSTAAGVRCLSAAWGSSAAPEGLAKANAPYVFHTLSSLRSYLADLV